MGNIATPAVKMLAMFSNQFSSGFNPLYKYMGAASAKRNPTNKSLMAPLEAPIGAW